jgi:tRNA-specific 2-thiouridylase
MVGEKIGEHRGAFSYTIGQRHGIGFSGHEPYYVVKKDVKKNEITVAEREDKTLYKKEINLINVNLINSMTDKELRVFVRVRYRQPLVSATFKKLTNLLIYKLIFDKPVEFVAEGQSAVFYDKSGIMLGGGVIA